MTIGISAFAWTSSACDISPEICRFVREAGFASLELPMFDPADIPVAALRQQFADNDLRCTVCCILPRGVQPLSADAGTRTKAQQHLRRCVETSAELGATLIGGPVLSPIGYLPGHRPTADESQHAVEMLHSLSALLESAGITLAIEPVNRSETHFVRTAQQAAALVDAVAHPRIGVTLDTFHANIEEQSITAAIDLLGPRLRHVHASENDRGPLGHGHVDFPAMVAALERNRYAGSVVVEGFGYDPQRPHAPGYLDADESVSPEALASGSKAYLDRLLRA